MDYTLNSSFWKNGKIGKEDESKTRSRLGYHQVYRTERLNAWHFAGLHSIKSSSKEKTRREKLTVIWVNNGFERGR